MKICATISVAAWLKAVAGHLRFACAAKLLLLLFALPAVLQAQDYTYTINNGTITITEYTGPGGDVIIPSTIDGLPVTAIVSGAFAYDYTLTSVAIPDCVTSIGNPAFIGCSFLTSITVDVLNSVYSSADGVLFNQILTTLVEYPSGKSGIYTVPDSVARVGDYAFSDCSNLTSVTIPDGVTSIGNYAFRFSSLTSIKIGNTVTSIGDGAFFGASRLTSVAIPNGVMSIGNFAFRYSGLTSVTIGNSVTNIGEGAFIGCTSLNAITVDSDNSFYVSVGDSLFNKSQTTLVEYPGGKAGSYTVPDNVTTIGLGAFESCINLSSVTMPNSVTSIGDSAFLACFSLTNVAIPNSVTNIGDSAFVGCDSLIRATIPNSVTKIGFNAFGYCGSLTSLTIGNGITSIEGAAFQSCVFLTGVYFKGDAPSFGLSAFEGATNATVYYLPGTTGWTTSLSDRPVVLWNPAAQTSGPDFGVRTNRFGFNITGTTNIPIVVEACSNLASAVWIPLQSCTLTNGSLYFSDPEWANHPARFYRLRSP